MTNSVAGLGLGVRARAPVGRSRVTLGAKPSVFGAPVVGKSVKSAVRKTVVPMAMSDAAVPAGMRRVEIPPVAEAPFVGIVKDMKARAPVYVNDFVQGISFKSVVSKIFFLFFFWLFPACRATALFFKGSRDIQEPARAHTPRIGGKKKANIFLRR